MKDYAFPKFVSASTTNITLSLLKDRAFAKMFAVPGNKAARFPVLSLGLFAARDAMTILASFTLPPKITPMFQVCIFVFCGNLNSLAGENWMELRSVPNSGAVGDPDFHSSA